MSLTEWKSFWTIRSASVWVTKKYRKTLTLLGLFSWAFNAGLQRFLEQSIDFASIASSMEQSIATKLPALVSQMESWIAPTRESISGIYADARILLQPQLPMIMWIRLWWTLISILLYMIVAHITLTEVQRDKSITHQWVSLNEIFKKIFWQLIPYMLTVLLQTLVTLFFLGIFIIPGIIVWTYFMFTNIIVLDQNKYFFSAMKESWRIVKWRWRETTWIAFSLVFIAMIILIFLWSVSGFIAGWVWDSGIQIAISGMVTTVFALFIQILLVTFYVRWKETAQTTSG